MSVPDEWVSQMRALRFLLLFLATGAMVATPAVAGQAVAPTTAEPAALAAPVVPTLVGVRAAHHPGYDRIVFDFTGGLPRSRQVRYVSRLVGDASGLPVPIAGQAILQVRFSQANAHDAAGRATAPSHVAFPLPNIMTTVRSGDFEAVTTYGVGLARREPFRVFTLTRPNRVVIDVNAGFRTVSRRVWFFDQPRFVAGREPYFTPVLRPVLPLTPATGVMDRIFAGPTPGETARGLRLLRSQATGYADLRVAGAIARVRLTGGCSSGGSTATVAGEIMPTLRQLATVSWVKIYDPRGRTERPNGRTDSIPTCLEP